MNDKLYLMKTNISWLYHPADTLVMFSIVKPLCRTEAFDKRSLAFIQWLWRGNGKGRLHWDVFCWKVRLVTAPEITSTEHSVQHSLWYRSAGSWLACHIFHTWRLQKKNKKTLWWVSRKSSVYWIIQRATHVFKAEGQDRNVLSKK